MNGAVSYMKPQPRLLIILNIVSVVFFMGALYMVFIFAPLEETMNYVQKIFYFHIANAWVISDYSFIYWN